MADDELLRRIDATLERNAQAFEDLQVVIRDSARREERSLQGFERALEAFERRMERRGLQTEANTAQIRAQTEAIWRMFDRWGEGPTPAS